MTQHLFGELLALATAVTWAFAVVLFKLSGERIPPLALNLYKNVVALTLLGLTLGLSIAAGHDSLNVLRACPRGDVCLLLLSGVIGIALADTLFFHALNRIGVGLMAIVDCCYSPLMVLFAWLLLGERLTPWHYVGAGLIVTAVFTATRHDLPPGRTPRQIAVGSLLAVLAIALMVFGIVIVKPILESFPFLWATGLRLAAGTVALALFALRGRNWRAHWTVFRPAASWRYALPGSVLGAYLCLMLWMGALKYTYASIVGILSQTSVVFQVVLATLILKEAFGRRRIVALLLAIAGVAVVTLSERLQAAALKLPL